MSATAILKPRAIEVEASGANTAIVTMEPFERGYGHTLGNALRRILLSSMIGYAPTEAQIAGVVHEYSTVPGVREDVVDILLNLKGVVLKLHNRSEALLTLKKKAEGAAFWYENSQDLVEIAVNCGSAAQLLGLKIGDRVAWA